MSPFGPSPSVERSGPGVPPTYVVTGASRGIGRAVVEGLASLGPARLVVLARDVPALDALKLMLERGRPEVQVFPNALDLTSVPSVRAVADRIGAAHPRIDALVNNAGALYAHRELTPEGIERTMALNVLAPVLLTERLRPALRAAAPSRVVMVASAAHRGARLDLSDLELRTGYRGFRAYARSKLALIELTRVLAERYRGDRIDVNSLHPGFIASSWGLNNPGPYRAGIRFLQAIAGRSVRRGARTPIYLATDPSVRGTTGRYFVRGRPASVSAAVGSPGQGEALWEWCRARGGLPAN